MRILDRYLVREFIGYLLLGLAGFVVIFIVVDIFEKVDVFLDHQASPGTVARFYLYRVPEVIVQVQPVALLLATFLGLGQLNKFGELTAMRASGLSLIRILAPVLALAVLSAAASLALGELIVPNANRAREKLYDEQIRQVRAEAPTERSDLTYLGEGGRIFYTRLYRVPERTMEGVSVQEFADGALTRRIDAEEAQFRNGRWEFLMGVERTFDAQGHERARPFDELVLDIPERPEDFTRENRKPDEMSYVELRSYIDKLRASGARVSNHLVDLHLKIAFPLVNVIVVAIGASLATRLRMQSAALGFGLSVAISFLYYGFVRTGQALGHNGALPPYLAAWIGDIVFGLIGLVMLAQAQRR